MKRLQTVFELCSWVLGSYMVHGLLATYTRLCKFTRQWINDTILWNSVTHFECPQEKDVLAFF